MTTYRSRWARPARTVELIEWVVPPRPYESGVMRVRFSDGRIGLTNAINWELDDPKLAPGLYEKGTRVSPDPEQER